MRLLFVTLFSAVVFSASAVVRAQGAAPPSVEKDAAGDDAVGDNAVTDDIDVEASDDRGAAATPLAPVAPPGPAPEPTTELSAEEQRELEEALATDAAARTDVHDHDAAASPSHDPSLLSALDPTAAWQAANATLASMNPAMAVILDAGVAWFSDEELARDSGLQRGGHDPVATGFFLQQLEISLGASVDPYLRVDANLVFTQFGVEVEEAYATTLSLPFALQARGGQLLTRFGRQNPTHPHAWSFVDQPLVLGTFFGGEGSRGLGAELSWLAPLPWYVEVIGSATEASGECCARSFFGGEPLPVKSPLDVVTTAAVKQFFPFGDDWSLSWGLSAQAGPNASGPGNRSEIYGTDLYLRWRPTRDPSRQNLSLTIEGLHRRRQVPNGLLVDHGFYAQAVWQLALRYELGARVEMLTGPEDIASLGASVTDPLGDPAGLKTRTSLEAAFYPSHFSRVRLQAAYGTPADVEAAFGSRFADPVFTAFLAFEVLAGAHGSHDF